MKKKTILEKIISGEEDKIDTVEFVEMYKSLNKKNKEKIKWFVLGLSHAEKC